LVKNYFNQIRILSGLTFNHDKSIMFLCGVDFNVKGKLMNVLSYKAGRLAVGYLGVPFITSKLTSSNCFIMAKLGAR